MVENPLLSATRKEVLKLPWRRVVAGRCDTIYVGTRCAYPGGWPGNPYKNTLIRNLGYERQIELHIPRTCSPQEDPAGHCLRMHQYQVLLGYSILVS